MALTEKLLEQIPLDFFQRNLLLPLEDGESLSIGVCPQSNREALEDVRLVLGQNIQIFNMEEDAIETGLRELLVKDAESSRETDGSPIDLTEEDTQDLLTAGKDAPIIKLVNTIFLQAIQRRGTDIHIEPYEKEAKVRIRTDGQLHETISFSKSQYSGVNARIKVMSKLDLAENRLPQDGRMRVKAGTRVLDVRVSLLPTQFGERIVLRMLDRSNRLVTLNELGLLGADYSAMSQLIKNPYGSILVTGPTGSGKSTTLYAVIEKLKSPSVNIITIEDPVEYQMDGIGQIPVNAKIGLTFASGLRSILRQDPDIVMVGEIRDPETAEIMTHASLTGHLVLSTLHTNDAPTAISRLVDMGIENYLISSSLLGVIAQRLVRTLCPKCKQSYEPTAQELGMFSQFQIPKNVRFYRKTGCDYCLNTGFLGRIGIFEMMLIDEQLRSAIIRSAESNIIRDIARKNGMKYLVEDGFEKVLLGYTTAEEVTKAVRA